MASNHFEVVKQFVAALGLTETFDVLHTPDPGSTVEKVIVRFRNQTSFVFNIRTRGRVKSSSFFVSYATFPDFELKFVLSNLSLSDIPTYLRAWINNEINPYLKENNQEVILLPAPFTIAQAIFQQTPLLASRKPWYKVPKYFIPAGVALAGVAFLIINALHETGPAIPNNPPSKPEVIVTPEVVDEPLVDTLSLTRDPEILRPSKPQPAAPVAGKVAQEESYNVNDKKSDRAAASISAAARRDSLEALTLENNYVFHIDRIKRIIMVGPKAGNWKAPFIGVSRKELKKVNPVVGCQCGSLVELKNIEFTLSADTYVDSIVAKRALYPPATKTCYYWLQYDSLPKFVIYGDTSDFNKTFKTEIARDR